MFVGMAPCRRRNRGGGYVWHVARAWSTTAGHRLSELFPTTVRYSGSSLILQPRGISAPRSRPTRRPTRQDLRPAYVGYYLCAARPLANRPRATRETADDVALTCASRFVGGPGIARARCCGTRRSLPQRAYGRRRGVWDPPRPRGHRRWPQSDRVTAYFGRLYDANYRDAATTIASARSFFSRVPASRSKPHRVSHRASRERARCGESATTGTRTSDRADVKHDTVESTSATERPHESARNMVRPLTLIDSEFRRLAAYPNTVSSTATT